MEAGYNSHLSRLSADAHYSEENLFNQSGPYIVSPYYYNSPPPVKPRPSNLKLDNQPLEMCVEDNLARRLMILTNALNQGKPIRVDDLLSLRPDSECDPKVAQLLSDLHAELRLAANTRPGGQLEPHLPVFNPSLLDTSTSHPANFDAHAVYAGDDAVSSSTGGRWSHLATMGVRNALSALMSCYGLDMYNPAVATISAVSAGGRPPPGKAASDLPQNPFQPSTSSQSAFSS